MRPYRYKNIFTILLLCNILSCQNIYNNVPNFKLPTTKNIDNFNSKTDKSLAQKTEPDSNYIIELSEKTKIKTGKSLSFKINNNYPRNLFSIKANVRSTNFMMINSYQVYLIEDPSSSGYPPGGDPLAPANIVAGPFIINLDGAKISPYVRFNNIGTSGSNTFYIAVRAFSGENASGAELLLPDNGSLTPWSGTTSVTPRVAVSETGVSIDASTIPTPLTALNINLNLDYLNSGNDIKIYPKGDYNKISYYKLNICTDPTLPLSTKVLSTPIQISKTYGVYDLSWLSRFYNMAKVWNIPLGKYYLTVEAYDSTNANIVMADNGGSSYSGGDAGASIAVSANSVTIFSDYFYNYSSADKSFFEAILNLISFSININNFAGSSAGTNGNTGDTGLATSATLDTPKSIWNDNAGNIYIADTTNNRIRKVSTTGNITNFAGNSGGTGGNGGDTAAATSAFLNGPSAVWRDGPGNTYIADTGNNRVRKVSTTGNITNFAGNSGGTGGNGGDTTAATSANLTGPTGVWGDNAGNIYIADTGNNRIRKVDATGIIDNFAGDPLATTGNTGDLGAATSAFLNAPTGVWGDNAGNIYIADTGNNRIRKVNASGIIDNFAGNSGGTGGNGGDTTAATSANLTGPTAVWGDNAGNIYIADTGNNRIRKVDATGIIDNFAGDPLATTGNTGDAGAATSAFLNAPTAVWGDIAGNIYVADKTNNRIRKIR